MSNIQKRNNKHLFIGELGEAIACRFLKEKDFKIIDRNYRKKWGELDIICKKDNIIHFVEVKTLSRKIERISNNKTKESDVIRETSRNNNSMSFMNPTHNTAYRVNNQYQPEDNIHPWKIKRLSRAIQSYILEKKVSEDGWQFDIIAILLDSDNKTARIRFTEDVGLF